MLDWKEMEKNRKALGSKRGFVWLNEPGPNRKMRRDALRQARKTGNHRKKK